MWRRMDSVRGSHGGLRRSGDSGCSREGIGSLGAILGSRLTCSDI